jgi:hypothetical protein
LFEPLLTFLPCTSLLVDLMLLLGAGDLEIVEGNFAGCALARIVGGRATLRRDRIRQTVVVISHHTLWRVMWAIRDE